MRKENSSGINLYKEFCRITVYISLHKSYESIHLRRCFFLMVALSH